MKPLRRRLIRIVFIFFTGVGVLILVAGWVGSRYIEKRLIANLEEVNGSIHSLHINLFNRSVDIEDFTLESKSDSLVDANYSPPIIHFSRIQAKGISLFQFLFKRKVSIRLIQITGGELSYNKEMKADSSNTEGSNMQLPFESLMIGRLSLNNIQLAIRRDTVVELQGLFNMNLHSIHLKDTRHIKEYNSYSVTNIELAVSDFKSNSPTNPYLFSVAHAGLNTKAQTFFADSIRMDPKYDKFEFAKVMQQEISRAQLEIDHIRISGLNWTLHQDTTIIARHIQIEKPQLFVFKDKRYPFLRDYNIPLPMEHLRTLPFFLEIDTLTLTKGEIIYEHFTDGGFKSGHMNFSDLNAQLENFSTRTYDNRSKYATLKAQARLMKSGKIAATFFLPLTEGLNYHAEGKIKGLPLTQLNVMLENTAFVKMESGILNELSFNFDYNDERSGGNVEIDYNDLKLITLQEEKNPDVNFWKTLLVNTLIQKNNTRTGVINIPREKKRFVFNLWAKSLIDGIKSAVVPTPALGGKLSSRKKKK